MDIQPPASTSPPALPVRRRKLALAVAAGTLGVIAVAAAWAVHGKQAPALQPGAPTPTAASLTVETISPQHLTLQQTVAASGSVAARDELVIGSDASGVRLLEVRVEVGSRVERGQLLARGDDRSLRAQLAQQDALIKQAEVDHAQALANLERAERVKDAGVFSVEAIQTRRSAADAAAAKLELAVAQRRELEIHLAHTQVLAPADGVIARRSATVGAVMQPGVELFRLIRDEQLEWLAELPAAALAKVQPGAKARVQLGDGRAVEASARLVEPTLDPRTRNGQVHVALPRGVPLKAGSHASGEITIGSVAVLTLPESVVFQRDGESQVWLVGPGETVRRQRVETGARERGLVEVNGLPAGARVVSTGGGFVKDGERVQVTSRGTAATGERS